MRRSHSGSIHVVTKDARFSRGFPSSISSSLMIWYAASLGISASGILNLNTQNPQRKMERIRQGMGRKMSEQSKRDKGGEVNSCWCSQTVKEKDGRGGGPGEGFLDISGGEGRVERLAGVG